MWDSERGSGSHARTQALRGGVLDDPVMSRFPVWAYFVVGVLAIVLAVEGIAYSEHAVAVVIYALLLAAGIASIVAGNRKRSGR